MEVKFNNVALPLLMSLEDFFVPVEIFNSNVFWYRTNAMTYNVLQIEDICLRIRI